MTLEQDIRRERKGFTLIEMMIVLAMAALFMAIGVPQFMRSLNREGFRKATSDLMEGFSTARAKAILSGGTAELVIRPKDMSISVTGGGVSEENQEKGPKIESPSFSAQMPTGVYWEILGVNNVELQEEDEVRVRFFSNGTCDEFDAVLRGPNGEIRRVTLEVITGIADMETVK